MQTFQVVSAEARFPKELKERITQYQREIVHLLWEDDLRRHALALLRLVWCVGHRPGLLTRCLCRPIFSAN